MSAAPPVETTQQKLIDQFWETIPSTWNLVRSQLHAIAMEKFEVTDEQWHVLRHIHKGANSVSELAQVKRITRSAISQSIDLLVDKGLVERKHDMQDRRYIHLSLTQAGSDLVNAIFQINRKWMLEKMAAFSDEEIDAMIHGMQLLKQVFTSSEG